jgi:hypothetical protein
MPAPPESGLVALARYFIACLRGRWQRGQAMKAVAAGVHADTAALDGVLGELGRAARAQGLAARPLAEENAAIDAAEALAASSGRARADVEGRRAEEEERFAASARLLAEKRSACDEGLAAAVAEASGLEAERRRLREDAKAVDLRHRRYLKGAEEREAQAVKAAVDARAALRRSAEDLRADAARAEPERAELDKRIAALDEALAAATARRDAARADLAAARKAEDDARAGHRHRGAELEAEAARQGRARADAEAEVGRRLITLGTLLNLNRVAGPELDRLYPSVDALRASLAAREAEAERLRAERDRIDRGALVRGGAILAAALVVLIALVCLAIALA